MCLHPNKYAFEFFSYSTVTVKWSGGGTGRACQAGPWRTIKRVA